MADDEEEEKIETLLSTSPRHVRGLTKKPLSLVVTHDKQPYVALETRDKVLAFVVWSASNGFRYSFGYHTISTTALHHPSADALTIITDRAVITLYGKNLLPIVMALDMHTCHSLTEFVPSEHLSPSDPTAPLIERIEVTLPRPVEKPPRVTKQDEKQEPV